MPEFIMNDIDASRTSETPFVVGFIEVLFFTESSPVYDSADWFSAATQKAIEEGQADGNIPGDTGYLDIHPDSLLIIREFCEAWQAKHAGLLARVFAETDYAEDQCGRDFFYVHAGHGVGFADRTELDDRPDLVEALTAAAGRGEINPWFGGHVTYGDAAFVHVDLY
jgi:hypothetical protein